MKPNDLVHSLFYFYKSIERSYDIDRKFHHVLLFYLLGAFNERQRTSTSTTIAQNR